MTELKKLFGHWTEENLLEFDIGFSRTSQEEIDGYCQMIHDNEKVIEYITHVPDIIERYNVSPDVVPILNKLYKAPEEPKKLPKDKQNHPNLEGGLFLCKSFSIKPFWVIFGKVYSPKFLKTKIYENDLYNDIYHDKQGYAYLMLPLLPFGNHMLEFVEDVYKTAWGMGLREDFGLFAPLVYHLSVVNFDNIADGYIDMYDQPDELENKFRQVFKYVTSTYEYPYHYQTGFHYSEAQKKFRVNGRNTVLEAQIGVLTSLLKAVEKKHGKDAANKLLAEYKYK